MKYYIKLLLVFTSLVGLILFAGWKLLSHTKATEQTKETILVLKDIKFEINELNTQLYRNRSIINNDAIRHHERLLNEGLHTLTQDQHTRALNDIVPSRDLLIENTDTFQHLVDKYQSNTAILKNSTSYLQDNLYNQTAASINKRLHDFATKFLLDYFYQQNIENIIFPATKNKYEELLIKHAKIIRITALKIRHIEEKIEKLSLETSLDTIVKHLEAEVKASIQTTTTLNFFFIMSALLFIFTAQYTTIKEYRTRLKAQAISLEHEQFVDALNMSAIVSKADSKGVITYVNDAFCAMSGYSREELLGSMHNIIRHPDNPPSLFREMWSDLKNGIVFQKIIRNLSKEGRSYFVDTTIIPILDENQDIKEYLAVRYDVTDLVKSRDAALTLEKSKDAFFSNMSHELRTPLNAIIGFSAILKKRLKGEKNLKQISLVHKSSEHLLQIINDILDLSKINSGKFSIDPEPENIYYKSEIFLQNFHALLEDKGLGFKIDIDDSLNTTLVIDWLRVSQIITNLLSNAIKFTPNGGEIKLSLSYISGQLCITVKDTGIGMSNEEQARIFMPFIQADGSTTRKYGGTGLGLAITSELINAMHGRIDLESSPYVGSTFYVYLPMEKTDEKISAQENDDGHAMKPFRDHVLVAEDNETNQLLITIMLEELGISCDVANDGVEAIEMYDPNKHQLILMDVNMPNMNGVEATTNIKESYPDSIIIALTADTMKGDRERLMALGMDEYLAKPLDEAKLYDMMSRYLHKLSAGWFKS